MAVTINIPSQVKTYANLAAFPASGSLKTIYIAEDTNKTYRWDGSTYVEISASAATGLTVGTTPISSGTIGRVLFEGTGNVLQQSGNLFWDSTNNRLGIGTSSPSQTLEIRNGFNLYSSGVSANAYYLEATSSSSTDGTLSLVRAIGGTGTTRLTFQGLELSTNTNSGENRLVGTSGQFWTFTTNGAEKMRLLTNGNLLLNTTTDAGFRLDVNGTARVQATSGFDAITFKSQYTQIGYLSTDNQVAYLASAPNSGGNYVGVGGGSVTLNGTSSLVFRSNSSERMRVASTGNLLINTTTDAGFKLDVNGTARFSGGVTGIVGSQTSVSFGVNGLANGMYNPGGNSLGFSTNSAARIYLDASNMNLSVPLCVSGSVATSPNASAQLDVNSTTKGFLPPRMTTTQRNAIASPAAGLMVYDTTLNAMFYFNGTIWI